jgi:ketosteroid isomerase-like protein
MSPFGGAPTRGSDMTSERWEAMGRFFKNGTLEQEVVQSYASADVVVLAIIERACVAVEGLPAQGTGRCALPWSITAKAANGGWRIGMPTPSSRASARTRQPRSLGAGIHHRNGCNP